MDPEFNETDARRAADFENEIDPVYFRPGGLDESTAVMHHSAKFVCPNCPRCPRLLTRRFEAYFYGEHLPCPTCGHPINLWEAIRTHGAFWVEAGIVGAVRSTFSVPVDGSRLSVDMADYGIPESAVIVSVGFAGEPNIVAVEEWMQVHRIRERYPGGGQIDEEFEGNPFPSARQPLLIYPVSSDTHLGAIGPRDSIPNSLTFSFDVETEGRSDLKLDVTWFDESMASPEWRTLLNAHVLVQRREVGSAMVLANAAVESRLSELVSMMLRSILGHTKADEFLKDTPYSHQLGALLPLIQRLSGWPVMPEELGGQLNRLRKLRNTYAHSDRPPDPIDEPEALRLINAAAFGLHYLGHCRRLAASPTAHDS